MKYIQKTLRRIPLTLKMVLWTILMGILVWAATDLYVEKIVDNMFDTHLTSMLERQSQEDRLRFDSYVKSYGQVVKLILGQRKFFEYLEDQEWFRQGDGYKLYSRAPKWFLARSTLRALSLPAYAIIFDSAGEPREVFSKNNVNPPRDLLRPSRLLLEKSHNQTFMSMIDNFPYLVASATVANEHGEQVSLMTASPIDAELMLDSQGDFPRRLVGLISQDGATLLTSNNSALLPGGVQLDSLQDKFIVTGREFHDYGSAEMAIRFASFVATTEIEELAAAFIAAERQERLVTGLAYIFLFTLLMLWVTRRIRLLTLQVDDFARNSLGAAEHEVQVGDKLDILAERFQQLIKEIAESHEIVRVGAEAATKRQAELDRKERHLQLLETVTESLGVGVLLRDEGELRPVNDLMRQFMDRCGDPAAFEVASGQSEERSIANSSGENLFFYLSGLPFLEQDTIILVRDISEQKAAMEEKKRLQMELDQAQKLESIGRLAGGVAHDFNNILTAINGYAQLTYMKMSGDDPLRDNIKTICESGERAAELTKQLLAFSRRQIISPTILNLNKALDNIIRMLARVLGEDIAIVLKKGDGLWNVLADITQIEQIVMNLAVNARDAMPGGGELVIETENVEIDQPHISKHGELEAGEYVRLSVSDNGRGISQEAMQHIFEPFFTTKEAGKGTGLGLATVYGVVRQNGGYIYVYSEPGLGTTFKIYLPRAKAEAVVSRSVADVTEMPGGTETILLVEDEQEVREYVVVVLSELGYTVIEATDGVEAENIFSRYHGRIDLLLTDVVMPRRGGRELADWVKEEFPAVKVLFMTGYTENAIVHQGVLEQDVALLQKPVSPMNLALAVRRVLNVTKA